MKQRVISVAALCTIIACVTACQKPGTLLTNIQATEASAPAPITPVVTIYAPTAAPTPMTQWQLLRPGVEYIQRREHVAQDVQDWVTMVRIDTAKAAVRVLYTPDSPHTVRDWFGAVTADAVINAGFFTPENKAAGLIISNGQRFGQTYKGFGGMFAIRDGKPQLQWLALKPYTQDQRVTQAVQSFPMLVQDGQVIDGLPDDGSRNRRSFIGIDRTGRVILGVCQSPVWTMGDLAHYLVANPLIEFTSALNLDGGASSGLWINGVPDVLLMDSLDVVPTVITVSSR